MNKVREFLKSSGYPEHVVEGGLGRLISNWEDTVRAVLNRQISDTDEYLNELDGRQIIHDVCANVPEALTPEMSGRLEKADSAFRSIVRRSPHSLWGDRNARDNGWTAEANWWYFTERPSGANSELES